MQVVVVGRQDEKGESNKHEKDQKQEGDQVEEL